MRGSEAELQPFFEGHPTANTDQTGQGISAEGVAAAGGGEDLNLAWKFRMSPYFSA